MYIHNEPCPYKTIKCYNNTNKKQVHKHDMCNAYIMESPPIINQNIHKNKT
jgi:CTP:phosphocholine cytidylyltransferase-like protein